MTVSRFIIIDDDPLHNKVCKFIISKAAKPGAEILDFVSANQALAYLADTFNEATPCTTILFLDINMPDINGWEFLTLYEQLPDTVQQQISIYILSSSLDDRDIDRALQNNLISDYIVKPLKIEKITTIINDHHLIRA